MSVFTNPASHSREQAREYTTAVLALLGERNPMSVLEQTPAEFQRAMDGLTTDQLRAPEAPGKWSMGQVLQHMADSELVWGYRLRMVLAHDRPAISGYDQDGWAERLQYAAADPRQSITEFAVLRGANLRLVARATPDDLRRVGVHAERGEESVAHMIRLYAGHDLLHIAQLERVRRATA